MDSFMLEDEGVRDRIRQAEDFLDPSMYENDLYHRSEYCGLIICYPLQAILMHEATDRTSF